MRAALRLLASVSRQTQYLEPGAPTGLTGLLTHPTPRSTLLYLYRTTLDKLQEFPEHSVYRQSTEALTKHRLRIIEETKPAGLEEWQERVAPVVDEHPEAFKRITATGGQGFNIVYKGGSPPDTEWGRRPPDENAEYKVRKELEGDRYEGDVMDRGPKLSRDPVAESRKEIRVETEPGLTLEQIGEIEGRLEAGLIEEVIQVAEGEKKLVETLAEYKVWEDLEEKPAENQWVYNERKNM